MNLLLSERRLSRSKPNEGDVLVTGNHERPKIWRVYERKKKD
jgi:hypothetical protein